MDEAKAKQVEDKIVQARVQMLLDENMAFFGTLAIRLYLKEASDWLSTAATDGKYLYYNVDFFDKMNEKEIMFVVAHEVLHCAFDHVYESRFGNKDKQIWNVATDYVINADLRESSVGQWPRAEVMPGGSEALYDPKYSGCFAEEVYKDIMNDAKAKQQAQGQNTLDKHLDGTPEEGSEQKEDDGGDQKGSGAGGPEPYSDAEAERIRDDFQKALIDAAKAASGGAGAGNLPASIDRMVKDLTEPKLDWRQFLNAEIQSSLKSDYTFMRPSRKSRSTPYYLPDMDNDFRVEAFVAIDVSGSISPQMLKDFLGEVKGIMEQFEDFELRVACFDTQMHDANVYTTDNIDDIDEFELVGGGGTSFECIFERLKNDEFQPHRLIVMTDGMPWDGWGPDDYCDTVWLIHGNENITAPHGVTVYYEEED